MHDRFKSAQEMQQVLEEILQSLDNRRYVRINPIDFQSVHRYESQLSASSTPVSSVSAVSTEQLQVQTNRWVKGVLVVLVLMLLTVLGLGVQVLRISPTRL